MKRFILLTVAALPLIILCSGCFAFVNTQPLAKNNEFKDDQLPGLWLDNESRKPLLILVEDKGDHYIIRCANTSTNSKFTVAKIKSADNKSMNFISINNNMGQSNYPELFISFGYKISGSTMSIYNFSDAKEIKEKLRQLPLSDGGKLPFTVSSDVLRKFFSENLNYFEEVKNAKLTKRQFKDQRSMEQFCALTDYFLIYSDLTAEIRDKHKNHGDAEFQKKIKTRIQQWHQKNRKYLSASFAQKFDQHFKNIYKNFEEGSSIGEELNRFHKEINDSCIKELL